MKKQYIVFLICIILISGCAYAVPSRPETDTPPYVMLLTDHNITSTYGRCGGVAIDEFHVLSAAHCRSVRGVTMYLYEVDLIRVREDAALDLVLYKTNKPLFLPEYAAFAQSQGSTLTWLYGMCTYFPSFVGRPFVLAHRHITKTIDDVARSVDRYQSVLSQACAHDSGSAVVQDGKVVGIVHGAVYDNLVRGPIGKIMFAIHYDTIMQFLHPTLEQN